MAHDTSAARKAFGDLAPALADYTDKVLFGDVWERPGLSPRDRSLITVASLVALYGVNELPFHLNRALDNGIGKEELVELITHLPSTRAGRPPARRCQSRDASSTNASLEGRRACRVGTRARLAPGDDVV